MDRRQLQKILEDMHRDAYLWSRQCCNYDDEMARDVLQAVYLKIFEDRARYNEKSSFRTWLFSVIRYTAIDSLKERHIHAHHALEDNMAVCTEDTLEEEMDYKALLQRLPEKQAQVLLLAFYHDMTLEAISTVMEIGLGTVRTHYERGKKQLKELIEKTKLQDHGGR
jgi:RNA polymerase sigma factor (sigma-70 family)